MKQLDAKLMWEYGVTPHPANRLTACIFVMRREEAVASRLMTNIQAVSVIKY